MIYEPLIFGIVSFFFFLCLFIIFNRIIKYQSEILFLMLSFICYPTICFLGLFFLTDIFNGLLFFITFIEMYYVLSLIFIISYPAFKIDIPTFKILYLLNDNKEDGLKKSDIINIISSNDMLLNRISELENDSMVFRKNKNLYLKPRGKFLVSILHFYKRKLMNLPFGEG